MGVSPPFLFPLEGNGPNYDAGAEVGLPDWIYAANIQKKRNICMIFFPETIQGSCVLMAARLLFR
jgi:hypothetical protein